jgi:DNA primase large subunit
VKVDPKLLIKYPFLPFLGEYLKEIYFDFEETFKGNNLILSESLERVKLIVSGKIPKYYDDPSIEIPIFVTSLYFVSQLGTDTIYRFADYESKRFSKNIQEEKLENLLILAQHLIKSNLEIHVIKRGPYEIFEIKMPLIDYLNLAPFLGGYNWALAFKDIHLGKVYLSKSDFSRLLEESYRQWIILKANELKDYYYPELEKILIEVSKEIEEKRKTYKTSIRSYEGIDPPCMRILINDLKSGKKLSHMGRFALVTYLHSINWSVEDVINLFKSLPDFREDITRYQVEHIFGLRGGRKVYSVPSCLTMKAASLCFPESPGCDNIKHPLQYLVRIKKLKVKSGKENN